MKINRTLTWFELGSIVGAIAISVSGVTAFAFRNFVTKETYDTKVAERSAEIAEIKSGSKEEMKAISSKVDTLQTSVNGLSTGLMVLITRTDYLEKRRK